MSAEAGVRRAVASFYLLTFAWSALWGLVPLVGPTLAPGLPAQAWFTLAGVPTMFGPLLVAIAMCRRQGLPIRASIGLHLRPNRWWLVAWAAPVGFVLLALLAAALLPGIDLASPLEALSTWSTALPPEAREEAARTLARIPPGMVALGVIVAGMVAGATINAVAAFGEEAGWRGFVPRLLAGAPFWPTALGTGALWGLWHAPLVLQGYDFPDAPVAGLCVMTLACALLTPPLLWLRGRAGSVLAAALFHGTLNGVVGLVFLFSAHGRPLWVSPLGVAGCMVLLPVNLVLALFVPRRTLVRDVLHDPPAR